MYYSFIKSKHSEDEGQYTNFIADTDDFKLAVNSIYNNFMKEGFDNFKIEEIYEVDQVYRK